MVIANDSSEHGHYSVNACFTLGLLSSFLPHATYIHLHVDDFLECLYSTYLSFIKERYLIWQLQMISFIFILYKPVVALDLASYQDKHKHNNH
jgi:hypothetical protein